jgi:hypothetical protein
MDEGIGSTVRVGVNIVWNSQLQRYDWTFDGPGVDPATGTSSYLPIARQLSSTHWMPRAPARTSSSM